MEQKTLSEVGQIYFGDSLVDGKGMRKGRTFFQSLSDKCYKNLARYWRAMDETDHLFTYSERQSPSYFMPSLASLCKGTTICEMPLSREKKSRSGYLDYWSHYRGLSVAIEVKHSWYNLDGKGMGETFKRWKKAHGQLEDANSQNISDGKPFLCLNMMVIPFDTRNKSATEFNPMSHGDNYHHHIMGKLGHHRQKKGKDYVPEPNIWSYWVLPEKMAPLKYEDASGIEKTHFYPAVALYGFLELRNETFNR